MRPLQLNKEATLGINQALNHAATKFASRVSSVSASIDTKSFFYSFFILTDEINKLYITNSFFYLIQSFPTLLYSFIIHLWVPTGILGNSNDDLFLKKLNSLLSLNFDSNPNNFSFSSALIILIWFSIVGILLLIGTISYKTQGHISKLILYLCAIVYECGIYFGVLPLYYILGTTFYGIQQSNNSSTIFFFIILSLCFIFSYLLYITSKAINYYTTPSKSDFCLIDDTYIIKFILLLGVFSILSHLTSFFGKSFLIFLLISSILVTILFLKYVTKYVFMSLTSNNLSFGISFILIGLDGVSLYRVLIGNVKLSDYLLYPLILFIISFIIYKKISSNYANFLNNSLI